MAKTKGRYILISYTQRQINPHIHPFINYFLLDSKLIVVSTEYDRSFPLIAPEETSKAARQ